MPVVVVGNGEVVHINTIEKFVDSEMRGKHVVKRVNLWDKPMSNVPVAQVIHGEEVTILDFRKDKRTNNVLWYKLQAKLDDGDSVKGWVKFPFIDESVEETYGAADIGW